MGRPRKGPDMAFLAQMLKEYGGVENTDDVIENVKPLEDVQDELAYRRRAAMAEVEGLIIQQHYKHAFQFKKCKKCSATFQTNYCYQSYCSPLCRDTALREHLGMDLATMRALKARAAAASYWEYEDPIILSPETIETVKEFCEFFLAEYATFKEQSENYSPPSPDQEETFELDSPFPDWSEEEDELPEVHSIPEIPGNQQPEVSDEPLLASSPFDLEQFDSDDFQFSG